MFVFENQDSDENNNLSYGSKKLKKAGTGDRMKTQDRTSKFYSKTYFCEINLFGNSKKSLKDEILRAKMCSPKKSQKKKILLK